MEEKEEGKRAYTRAHAFDLDIDIILAQLSNTILATSLANTHTSTHNIIIISLLLSKKAGYIFGYISIVFGILIYQISSPIITKIML